MAKCLSVSDRCLLDYLFHYLWNSPKTDKEIKQTKKKMILGVLFPNKRTNGHVNAHLRSAAYTNKHV